MVHPGARSDERLVLRMWPAPARLSDDTPLWVGTVQTMRYRQVLDVGWLWLPVDDDGAAHARLREDLAVLDRQAEDSREDGVRVLRLRTTPAAR